MMKRSYLVEQGQVLPEHWTRHPYMRSPAAHINDGYHPEPMPRCFYVSSTSPEQYWYPSEMWMESGVPPPPLYTRLLECLTERAWYFLAEEYIHKERSYRAPFVSIRDASGGWVGVLQLPNRDDLATQNDANEQTRVELAITSEGYFVNASSVDLGVAEWKHPERPQDKDRYRFFNVLWVEWEEGVAYRKAIGRIHKESWKQASGREAVDLILG